MARKTADVTDDDFTERIVDVDVSSEMQSSFLEYAYSVIYARALPDARDGLKPVQRRILFAMDEMNLRPDRGHVKCARVVGQVMGLYHPHGDTAIYDALVRLAQDWTMRLPLIDGHGNFGSPDAGPAAMRYTECRMDHPALAMTDELDQDTVDFKPNYDGKESEPVVLPAAFPNLLVNGTTGIAVGMATNIPPHNLVEVVQALRHLLKHPNANLDTLMRFIPGPDLPTGGRIVGLSGIADAYATGKGSFKIRATARIEKVTPRRQGIVVTELPYLVGTEKVIEQIKKLVQTKKLTGIADVKDLADLTSGTRLVIEIKNGFNPEAVLEQLYRLTKLEDSFSINAVALVEGQPRTMSLFDMLTVFLEHRLQVTLRRTTFNRNKAADRLHLVEGLLIAILDIDDVIAIIRAAEDAAAARAKLIEVFDLTELQANYILDMQLRRLTKFSRIELESERDELAERIAALNEIIDNDDKLRAVVNDELADVAKRFGTPRRTVLLESAGQPDSAAAAAPLEIADAPCWLLLSATGLVARVDTESPLPERANRAKHDVLRSVIKGTSRGDFGVITSAGRVIRMNALDLPTVPLTASAPNLAGGSRIGDLITLERGEEVLCLASLDPESPGLAVGTAQGVVKIVKADILTRDTWEVITFKDPKDRLVGAVELSADGGQDLVFITSDAQLLRYSTDLVNPQGRTGSGVAGIRQAAAAVTIFFGVAPTDDGEVVTITAAPDGLPGTDTATIKVTPLSAYPPKGRATAGVRCHRFLKGEERLQLAWAGAGPAVASSSTGTPVELPAADPRRDGSGTPLTKAVAAIESA
ncbi:MAG: DNA topoisomerase IV subunit A [Propionibacteriaceae bacterium]|nr:DNA topoisomerase IV subunit A [Propionibacteriaceae bacterium]